MLGRVLPGRYGDAVEEVRSGVLPWLMEQQQQQQQQQLRSLRDFLLVYNRMTELCFQRCVPSLHHRALDAEEEACLHSCAGKLIHSNHRLMAAYVQLMPALVQRRIADYEAVATGPGAAEQPGNSPPGS